MIITYEDRLADIQDRWIDVDYDKWYWRRPPAEVRILIYAEGGINFDGGGFDGLQHVIATLNSDPYSWVDFQVTTAHRGSDPDADQQNKNLDDLNLQDNYDEVWLFGIRGSEEILEDPEVRALEDFMDAGGGVLTTGDHHYLGLGLSDVKRLRDMRKYPAPKASSSDRYSSLREGQTQGYQFTDQSDRTPQELILEYTRSASYYPQLSMVKYPHPVMCGPEGPIDVFPDHEHEGAAIEPSSYPSSDWPSDSGGYQPKVNVVAHAEAVDTRFNSQGDTWGVVGTYDGHRAEIDGSPVGRIVADATWHHWFDINLDGFYSPQAPPKTKDIIKQIEAYYLNVAVWLAPKERQKEMRNAACWSSIFVDPLIMFDLRSITPTYFGAVARNAIGQWAPQCTIRQWTLGTFPRNVRLELEELRSSSTQELRFPFPLEDIALGSAVGNLVDEFSSDGQTVEEYVGDEVLNEVFEEAGTTAIERFEQEMEGFREQIHPVIGSHDR